MNKYYIYVGPMRYDFTFYNIRAAFEMCREIGGDCVVCAETGEVLAVKG